MRKLFLLCLFAGALHATPSCPVWMGQAEPYAVGTIVVHGTQNYKVVRTLDNGWIEPTNAWFWNPTTETCVTGTTPPGTGTGTGTSASVSNLASPLGGTGGTKTTFGGIPAYLFLEDNSGGEIKGGVKIEGREGSIEAYHIDHKIWLPTDPETGALTGTRKHGMFTFLKKIDPSSPYLFSALTQGQTLVTAEFKFYQIDETGAETEYYNVKLEGVKVTSLHKINTGVGYAEEVALRYQKITETFLDGNLQASDSWNQGR